MRTTLKIVLIVFAFIVTAILITISKELSGSKTGNGPFGIILLVAFLAGARAIWKYNPDEKKTGTEINKTENKDQQLDKS